MEKDFKEPSHSVTITGINTCNGEWKVSNSWAYSPQEIVISWGDSPVINESIELVIDSISKDDEIELEVARLISDMEK